MAPHATSRKGAKTQKKDHNKVKIDNLLENFMVLLKEQQLSTPKFFLFQSQSLFIKNNSFENLSIKPSAHHCMSFVALL